MSDLALRTLLAAITDVPAGTKITADTIRLQFDLAQLNTSERGAAFKAAERLGYLRGTDKVRNSVIPSRKHSAQRVWIRTRKPIPSHLCEVAS